VHWSGSLRLRPSTTGTIPTSPEYVDKNYAATLPWVDKIFGTLYLPKDKQPARYGINQPVSPVLLGQLVHPFMIWRKNAPLNQAAPAVELPPSAEYAPVEDEANFHPGPISPNK
jgi:hypothetical protein